MAYKTWNVGDVLTSADMNTYVRDQAPTVCTSGTRPASPATGKIIFETDTGLLLEYTGSAWEQIGGTTAPRGRLNGIAPITSNQTGITANVDVTGGSFTQTLIAGRRYKFTVNGLGCYSSVVTDNWQISLVLGGVTYAVNRGVSNSTTQANSSLTIVTEVACVTSGATAPTQINAGSTVCKLQVSRGGTGNLILSAAATAPTVFFVEDIGV